MPTDWYYTRNGRVTLGPFTSRKLKHMASTGQLLPTDVVGKIGMEKAVRAQKVNWLFKPE